MIIHGDSVERLRELEAESVDALVTDPPYGLGDTSPKQVAECLRAWSSGSSWEPRGGGLWGRAGTHGSLLLSFGARCIA